MNLILCKKDPQYIKTHTFKPQFVLIENPSVILNVAVNFVQV